MTRKKQIHIIVGEKYGVFTIKEDSREKGYKRYVCVCEKCGRNCNMTGQNILKHQNRGCLYCRQNAKYEEETKKYKQMIGERFGDLTVTDYVGHKFYEKYGYRVAIAACRCEKCGNATEIPFSRLKTGQAKQCRNCNYNTNLPKGQEIIKLYEIEGTSIASIKPGRRLNKNSTTGHTGVSALKNGYRSYITFKRKQYSLGCYKKLEEAIEARKKAEENIYGGFLEWYRKEHPKEWEIINKRQD